MKGTKRKIERTKNKDRERDKRKRNKEKKAEREIAATLLLALPRANNKIKLETVCQNSKSL